MFNLPIKTGITLDVHPDYQNFVELNEEGLCAFRQHIALHGLGQALAMHATGHRITSVVMPALNEKVECKIEHQASEAAATRKCQKVVVSAELGSICRLLAGFVAEYLCEGTEYGSVTSIDEWYEAQVHCKDFASRHSLPYHHVLAACVCAVEGYFGEHEALLHSASAYLAGGEGQQLRSPRRGHLFNDVPRRDLGKVAYVSLSSDWLDEEYERIERLMP